MPDSPAIQVGGRPIVITEALAGVATVLSNLAAETGSERLSRDHLRRKWTAFRPDLHRPRAGNRDDDPTYLRGNLASDVLRKSLSTFEGAGLVRRDGDTVVVLDRAALRLVAIALD